MPQLDFNSLINQMIGAASGSLKENWPAIKDMATSSMQTLAQNLVDIEKMKLDGSVTEEKARLMIDMQKSALKTVLLTEEGLGILAAEAAVNAVIGIVRDAANTAIGWKLL